MKLKCFLAILALLPLSLISRDLTFNKTIYWNVVEEIIVKGKLEKKFLLCNECEIDVDRLDLPSTGLMFDLASGEVIQEVRINVISSDPVTDYTFTSEQKKYIKSSPEFIYDEAIERKRFKGIIKYIPLVQRNGRIEKLTSYDITVITDQRRISGTYKKNYKNFSTSSVLASGEWYRFGVTKDAVYKLSRKFLKDRGVDVDNIDPKGIALFGNGGAMLPRANSDFRPDDLVENAIFVKGESDGSFDAGDYILFYGQGPNKVLFDNANKRFYHETHEYSDTTYYYLRVDNGSGKRVSTLNTAGPANAIVTTFTDFRTYELDKTNLLKSGAEWFGEEFDIQTSYTFPFDFPNVNTAQPGNVTLRVSTASKVTSDWELKIGNESKLIEAGSASGGYAETFATSSTGSMNFAPSSSRVNVLLTYNKKISSGKGWLDYIDVNVSRRLIMTGQQLQFSDPLSLGNTKAQYNIGSAGNGLKVWDVTDPYNVSERQLSFSGGTASFINDASILRKYVAFQDFDSTIFWVGGVQNQNLHGAGNFDYIIVSHPKFLQAAERLKSFHENNGLSVVLVTPQEIYNEFSSGSQDIVAIRDFVRMMYVRSTSPDDAPKYMLFMGDGSYDNKFRIAGNTNYIPSFQSFESFNPVRSYVSDDFYCMLDSNEGVWRSFNDDFELMDISVGRLPVQTEDQAMKLVEKIERYESPAAMGDWRNIVAFVGDDEDRLLHMSQADALTEIVEGKSDVYNIEKVFLDAYKQVSTPGGERYPDARETIKRRVERGALIVNYTGHGGEVGWAHERVLTMDEINNWSNKTNMPLFVTATCEFSRWDDPERTSGGEVTLVNPIGGGIALLTTVRLVYASANFQLSTRFYNQAFDLIDGKAARLGDIYISVKNDYRKVNTRNFTLLGDPALVLAYPQYNVITDSINGVSVTQIDTVGALGLMEVKGHLEDNSGNRMTNFNGTLYPTIYDKKYDVQSQDNDSQGPFPFKVQDKKLFKGRATVKNGEFTFKCIIPKDISYNYGNGKISYYAENQIDDANGASFDFVIGGTDPNAAADNQGPDIELYMNDETFVYGGITDENPLFIAKVFDEHGINMAGTGIGHNITAILDDDSDDPIILNDYYSATIDSYQEGMVQYPFQDLEPGNHKITLKVWDVYNNSSEATLEFVVQEYKELSINRVLNYPNPFTTNTSFWFEHNQPNTVLDVNIQIFTISGKIVKTIDRVIESEGYTQNLKDPISWNGRDDYGDKLGRGVYIYKIQVKSRRNGTSAEKIEKLVIL